MFNSEPSRPSSDAIMLVDDVQEDGGDGVEELGDDHTVHATPRRIVKAGIVTEDMVL